MTLVIALCAWVLWIETTQRIIEPPFLSVKETITWLLVGAMETVEQCEAFKADKLLTLIEMSRKQSSMYPNSTVTSEVHKNIISTRNTWLNGWVREQDGARPLCA